jgi:hypothetical protein
LLDEGDYGEGGLMVKHAAPWLTVCLALALLFGAAGLQRAAARDIYVSNKSGNDRHQGSGVVTAGQGPVQSIGRALELAVAGDRIIVENTGLAYREALSLTGSRVSGSLIAPLVIEGQGATLDGSVAIDTDGWRHVGGNVFAYQPRRQGFQQLFIDGQPASRRLAAWNDAAPPRLDPHQWCFWRGEIYVCLPERRLPSDYQFGCCGLQTGITLYHVDNVMIRGLTVQGFQLDGVAVHDVVRDTLLMDLDCRANGQCGISVRGASRVELDGCKASGNGVSQLRVADFARVWLYNCELRSDTAAAMERLGGQVFFGGHELPISPSFPAGRSP